MKLAFETMNQALLDNLLDQLEEVVGNLRANQLSTENGFKKYVVNLIEDICGKYATDNQKEYMSNERKPKEMSISKFS